MNLINTGVLTPDAFDLHQKTGMVVMDSNQNDSLGPAVMPWEDDQKYKKKLSKLLEVQLIDQEDSINLLKMLEANDLESVDLAEMIIDTKINSNTKRLIDYETNIHSKRS